MNNDTDGKDLGDAEYSAFANEKTNDAQDGVAAAAQEEINRDDGNPALGNDLEEPYGRDAPSSLTPKAVDPSLPEMEGVGGAGGASAGGAGGDGGNGVPPSGDSPSGDGGGERIRDVTLVAEMERSYLDYAMSVIVSRALPDARDGLKPVHRRILYSMYESGYRPDKQHRKSARVVGDVIGKYHPHGDQSVYDALVRMAQTFSMRLPLIDGQGNFGSVDGDPPAAMRYTEVKLAKPAMPLLEDLDFETVDFRDNYDGTEQEPVVLPARYPNLLVNGSSGIAVGMATNIPPHNLGEIIDALLAIIENPDIAQNALLDIVQGPDFPTGAFILGRGGIRQAYLTGRGSIIMRAKVEIEPFKKDRVALIITAIPFQLNKTSLIERISELVRDKTIESISEIRDESDREGMRLVLELKRDAVAEVTLNQLWRHTPMQSTFGVNMIALNGFSPQTLTLKSALDIFLEYRQEIIERRTAYLLEKARNSAHLQVGLAIAVANIDEVIRLIRGSASTAAARAALMERYWPAKDMVPLIKLIDDPRHSVDEHGNCRLTEEQARAILDMRLARLTALGRDEIERNLTELEGEISGYLEILSSQSRIMGIIRDELIAVRNAFATPRLTQIIEMEGELEDEDLIEREDMVVLVSHAGYIKRVPLATYRAQRRGGKGRSGMQTREEDFVTRLFVAVTHQPLLFFSSKGRVYREKVWRLPLATSQGRGRALVNLLPLQEGERINAIMALGEHEADFANKEIMFATSHGSVRRNLLADFVNVNRAGKLAMRLEDGESIVDVQMCAPDNDVLLTTARGHAIRFAVEDVRLFKGRDSTGVRGIALEEGDAVIALSILRHSKASAQERLAYLRRRRALAGEENQEENAQEEGALEEESRNGEASQGSVSGQEPLVDVFDADGERDGASLDDEGALSPERYVELSAREEIILSVSEKGYGKRTSAYEYRVTGRGGKGVVAMLVNERNGALVANLPVEEGDEIMLVTDGGQLIRCPVRDIRIAGRATQGVIVFKTAKDERVVSVERVSETVARNGPNGDPDADEDGAGAAGGFDVKP